MFPVRYCVLKQLNARLSQKISASSRGNAVKVHWKQCLHRLTALTFARGYSSKTPSDTNNAKTNNWEFDVTPRGTFTVRTGAIASVYVKPIDPQKYPMQNKAFVKVTAQDDGTDDATISCSVEESNIVLTADHDDPLVDKKLFACDVELPIQFDVDMEVEGGRSIAAKGFENSHVIMRTDQGSCYLFSLKTGTADVHTLGGSIVSKSYIQTNGTFSTCGEGDILMDRVLGMSLDVITEEGDIDVKAVYADESRFSTESGSVYLKSCHRTSEVNIDESGNLTVGTLDGNMKATINQGNVDIYFTQHGHVDVQVQKGNMLLQMADSADTNVDLSGSKVKLDANLIFTPESDGEEKETCFKGHLAHSSVTSENDSLLEKPHKLIKAHTKEGNISVDCKDWLASLKLIPTTELEK